MTSIPGIAVRGGDFDAFFEVPFNIYDETSPYVSPMRSDLRRFLDASNPLFEKNDDFAYYTAHDHRDGGRPVGRILVHHHAASNQLHGTNDACFGYFDCMDDPAVAKGLLHAAESWARRRGFDRLVGNFNMTAMQQIGVMTGGFTETPYVDQVQGPAYLPVLLEAEGYERFFPMRTFEVDLTALDPEAIIGDKQRAILSDPDYSFAPITRGSIPQRLVEAREILNDGFVDNPMFVPLTEAEFEFQAKELKWVIDRRITSVLHHKGRPVGVVLIIPDLNPFIRATRSRIGPMTAWHYLRSLFERDRALLVYMSVTKDMQGKGVIGAALHHAATSLKAAGYKKLGITWVWDGNKASLRQMESLAAKPLHDLHLFRKVLA